MPKLKVELASMHQAIFIPGVGNVGPELHSTPNPGNKATKMELQEQYLKIEVLEAKISKTKTVLIPLSNFKSIVVSEVE